MRIETIQKFESVSIILETQEEVNFMHELTRNISGVGEMRNFFSRIGSGLEPVSTLDYSDQRFDGCFICTR